MVSAPLKMYFHLSPRARLRAGSPELTLIWVKNLSKRFEVGVTAPVSVSCHSSPYDARFPAPLSFLFL